MERDNLALDNSLGCSFFSLSVFFRYFFVWFLVKLSMLAAGASFPWWLWWCKGRRSRSRGWFGRTRPRWRLCRRILPKRGANWNSFVGSNGNYYRNLINIDLIQWIGYNKYTASINDQRLKNYFHFTRRAKRWYHISRPISPGSSLISKF